MTPSEPNQASYPISALYLFPVYATAASHQAATGQPAPFTSAKPIKLWARPLGAGEDPTSYQLFNCTKLSEDGQTETIANFPMTLGDAAAVNIPPDASGQGGTPVQPAVGSVAATQPPVPIPIRALLSNEKLVATPFGVTIERTDLQPAPAPSVDTPTIQQIAATVGQIASDVAAIKAKVLS